MRTIVSAKRKQIATPEPIDIGGTGSTTAQTAIAALEGVSTTQMDVPSGNAVLDQNTKVKPENIPELPSILLPTVVMDINTGAIGPHVVGVKSVEIGNKIDCFITNYDINETYNLSLIASGGAEGASSVGSVVLQTFDHCIEQLEQEGFYNTYIEGASSAPGSIKPPGTVTYQAPDKSGIGGFTLNGVSHEVTIKNPAVPTPTITSPITNGVCTHPQIVVIAEAEHYWRFGYPNSVRFQLSESSDFSTIVSEFVKSDTGVTTFTHTFTGLQVNKLYYLRTQSVYSVDNIWSEWSSAVSFATPSVFSLTEIQKISPTLLNTNGLWNMDYHEDILVIGTPYARMFVNQNIYGNVDIYVKNTNPTPPFLYLTSLSNVVPEETPLIIENDSNAFYHHYINSHFGTKVCLSKNENYIFATAPNYTDLVANGISDTGAVIIFKTSDGSKDWTNTMTHVADVEPSPLTYTDPYNTGSPGTPFVTGFAWNLCISQSDNIIYFAVTDAYDRVIVYKLDTATDTITLMQTIVSPEIAVNTANQFGGSTAFSDDGQVLVIGCNQGYDLIDQDTQLPIMCGAAFVYRRVADVWTLEQKILPVDTTIEYQLFGNAVAISHDGQELFIGDSNWPESVIYVYHNNGSNQWVLTQTIVPTGWSGNNVSMSSMASSIDDTRLIIGSADMDNGHGKIIIMKKINNIWTEVEQDGASDPITDARFGSDVAISDNGLTHIASASPGNTGIYIFE